MKLASNICYTSHDQKRSDYRAKMVPRMFVAARRAAASAPKQLTNWLKRYGLSLGKRDATVRDLRLLHHAARGGRYVMVYPLNCDTIQPVEQTLARGGDCDHWAIVVMAVLSSWGVEFALACAGDELDPFQHAYVRAQVGGVWYTLDPKPDQRGEPFDTTAPAQRTTLFKLEAR